MKIDKIYIIHYDKEIERKKYLDNILPSFSIPYEYRSLYNRNSPEILRDDYFDQTDNKKNKINAVINQYGINIDQGMPLEWGERARGYRAVTLEHYKTYEHVVTNTNYENVLIIEDDIIFDENFCIILQEYLKTLPSDYDVCYLGSCCNMKLPYYTDKILDKHPYYFSKCSDSYIVGRSALQKIVKTALPFFGAIDWELNYLQALHKLNVYWVTEPKIYQGSQTGQYSSTHK